LGRLDAAFGYDGFVGQCQRRAGLARRDCRLAPQDTRRGAHLFAARKVERPVSAARCGCSAMRTDGAPTVDIKAILLIQAGAACLPCSGPTDRAIDAAENAQRGSMPRPKGDPELTARRAGPDRARDLRPADRASGSGRLAFLATAARQPEPSHAGSVTMIPGHAALDLRVWAVCAQPPHWVWDLEIKDQARPVYRTPRHLLFAARLWLAGLSGDSALLMNDAALGTTTGSDTVSRCRLDAGRTRDHRDAPCADPCTDRNVRGAPKNCRL